MSSEGWREVWRDGQILVVDKAAGWPSQRTRDGDPGIYELLREREAYVALHHRLDRRASGLLLFALDPGVNKALTAAFRAHTIQRTYLALCEGEVVAGTWSWKVDGKSARTDVEPVRVRPDGTTEVVCRLHTGRTHQIRIHGAMNGTPLVGDRRYGGDLARPWERLGLHAARLGFDHPGTGERVELQSTVVWAGSPGDGGIGMG